MEINTSFILQKSQKEKSAVKPKREKKNLFNKEFYLSFPGSKNKLKNQFFSEAAVLIGSGMDLKSSLEIILGGTTKKADKVIIEGIISSVTKGSVLSSALERSGKFSSYDFFTVRIGEESGSLDTVLGELSSYYSKKISQQRQIKGALTYPILVLITTFLSLYFMLCFIVPMFKDVFMRFNGNLPVITQAVISLSNSFSRYTFLFLAFASLVTLSIYLNRKKESVRKTLSFVLLKIPIVSPIVKLTYKTRFCQTLKLLLRTKVHLLDALALIEKMIGFYPLEKALADVQLNITKGYSLYRAMEQHNIFDRKLISMTKVAEEVNKLDIVYNELYKQYSEELDTKIRSMNSLLEPVLIIFVGGIVALILISMYMPIFQIGTNIY